MSHLHWHVLGAGAMGCLFAGLLREAGSPVTLLLRDEPAASHLPLVVEDEAGRREFQVAASAASGRDTIDHLLVSTKAYDVVAAVATVAHRLDRDSQVLLLSNGLGFEAELRERLPHIVFYSGTTTEGAYSLGPQRVYHAGRGTTRLGQPGRATPPPWFSDWADAVSDSQWDPDIEQALWLKLAINCAINPLTAIHRCANGELLKDPALAVEVECLCREIRQVGEAAGMVRAVAGLDESVARVIRGTAANRSSMLQDILAGRRTEIDYINGYLLRIARQLGVPVPRNAEVVRRVSELAVPQG